MNFFLWRTFQWNSISSLKPLKDTTTLHSTFYKLILNLNFVILSCYSLSRVARNLASNTLSLQFLNTQKICSTGCERFQVHFLFHPQEDGHLQT